jgi:hypothetical protein
MVGNGMEQASGYPWERLGDSVLVTFVSAFLRILADSVLKIRETKYEYKIATILR